MKKITLTNQSGHGSKFFDQEAWDITRRELGRQRRHIELIASENFASPEVLAMTGTILTNKYAEGYPGRRYYGGCEHIDEIETLAIKRACELFKCRFANVQAHSGSTANLAAYFAVLNPHDKILAMDLSSGGHLTHGHKVNFSGAWYEVRHYGVDQESEMIDMEEVMQKAMEFKPKLIIAGASNYSRLIDFKRFREVADACGALLLCDIAHIAGLIAAGVHPSPFPHAHIVTTTTHKTLRGPRGAMIMSNDEEIAKKIDRAIFPGTQGGPLEHVIGAKAVAFLEALQPSFKEYSCQVVTNCRAMSDHFLSRGCRIVSGGTDNHLLTVDVSASYGITGAEAEKILSEISVTANKNTIPYDDKSPTVTSGLRLGTAAMTTRGLKEEDFIEIAEIIHLALSKNGDLGELMTRVETLTGRFPLYPGLEYEKTE